MQRCSKCNEGLYKDRSFRTFRDMSTNQDFTLCTMCIIGLYDYLGFTKLDQADPIFIDGTVFNKDDTEYYKERIVELQVFNKDNTEYYKERIVELQVQLMELQARVKRRK